MKWDSRRIGNISVYGNKLTVQVTKTGDSRLVRISGIYLYAYWKNGV